MQHQDPSRIPIAIVGMACRLPGAEDLDQYWQLLINGRSAVVEMPPDRLDQSLYFDPREGIVGKTYSKLGALLSNREFDRARCPIPEELANSVDSVHLLMCDVAASALKHAGYDPFNVPLPNTGVYIGHAQGSTLGGDQTYATCVEEAAQFLRETPQFQKLPAAVQESVICDLIARVRSGLPQEAMSSPDVAASLVAGTISKAFGLSGPYLAINSACASSLQAMLLGARALQMGSIDMAIVGGASDCKSDSLVLFSHARAMSASGSRPFDADANGLIVGEGYVAVVMKRLDRALADGDHVWAVVRGIGVSSDGRGKSLWAPRKEGQVKAMERAYRGGLDMGDIEYIEAHATATQLGDATELNTLTELFERHFPAGKRIPITSVKANIGHTLETAGLAGVIKTVLAMHHETIPPAINISQLNPQIDWQRAPIYVPTKPVSWPKHADGKPRRAGVNAFGIGGLNMHVALDDFNESHRALVSAPQPAARPAASKNNDAIAVIGLGCVLPGAANPNEFWQLLVSRRDPKVPVPKDRWNAELALNSNQDRALKGKTLLGGFITDFVYDWKRHKLPPKQIAQADPLQFMLLDAADQAMQDAGYHEREFPRENGGVVVGTEFGGDFAFQLQLGLRLPELERHIEQLLARQGVDAKETRAAAVEYSKALLKSWPALIDETGSFSTSSLASRIGKTWNLMGGAAAIDAGHTSGLAALSISVDMLLGGDCDIMLCAAGQRRMGLPEYEMLAKSGVLSQGTASSPLDAQSNGIVPGEGVVVLLLKRLADAERDGDRVHAVLHKVAAAHDISRPGKALEMALERTESAVPISDVACLEFDAPDSPRGVESELAAVREAYRRHARKAPLLVGSPVGQIGHTQGASSLVLLLKAILESNAGELPATFGLHTPSETLAKLPAVMQSPKERTAIDLTTSAGARMAAVASTSRGLAYHVVLESGTRAAVAAAGGARSQNVVAAEQSEQDSTSRNVTPMAESTSTRVAELEQFLINFVVEQTGYPPEVIELDANLEADLGIDSIKKVQMFGELREYFDIQATGNVTLNDFPTLRHIVEFLASAPVKSSAADVISQQPVPSVEAAPVVAAMPAAAVAPPALIATALEETAPATASMNIEEIEKFLIDFVVEQTGYPPEVIELDANLEADLGIDSIKKVQMFGELREYFDIQTTGNMTLNDFPTLRHIVNFLATVPAVGAAPVAETMPAPKPVPSSPALAPAPVESAYTAPPAPTVAAPRAVAQPASSSSQWRIYRIGALDRAGLVRGIEDAVKSPQNLEQCARRTFTPKDRHRLAIVADGPETLSTRLTMALKQIHQPAAMPVLEQNGIFIREAQPNMRIAFLFAGQGSQYPGMLRQLIQDVPETRAELQRIDAVMTRLRHPSWEQLTSEDSSLLGKDVWATQISMLLADSIMLAALRARGIEPDVVAGHSYGEYAALVGAGAWELEQAARVTGWRCDSIESSATARGTMLATTAPPEAIEQFARQINGQVFVANLNAPDQTVVGGTAAALTELEGVLRANRFDAKLIPVPSPFHTPLMREAADKFATRLSQETFQPPRVATYSVVTNEVVRTPDEILSNLVAHLVTPVRYAELIQKLAAEAPTVFVEVGPQQALTRLNRRILAADQFAGIASDNPSSPGVEQLERVRALLECTGALDRNAPPAVAPSTVSRIVMPAARAAGEVWHFDATARRREKRRQAAEKGTAAPVVARTQPSPASTAAPARPTLNPAPPPKQVVAVEASARKIEPPPVPVVAAVLQPATVATAPAPSVEAAVSTGPEANVAELEQFLINFVVEQTGYPPEVIELDANLEADLGIDSIKKVQMFGELREYFDISATGNLSLNDFPTLRHIVNFLANTRQKSSADESPEAVPEPVAVASPIVGNGATASPTADPQTSGTLSGAIEVLRLDGTPYEMGREHGTKKSAAIRTAVRRIADLIDGDYNELPIPPGSATNPRAFFSDDEFAELQGMADAVAIPVGNLAALNLTLRESLAQPGDTLDTTCTESSAAALATTIMERLVLPAAFMEVLCPVVITRGRADGVVRSNLTFAGLVGDPTVPRSKASSNGQHKTNPTDLSPASVLHVDRNGTNGAASHTVTKPRNRDEAGARPALTDGLDSDVDGSGFRRYVMRLSPVPWETQPADFPVWKGAAAIVGDNPVADALQQRLEAGGANVIRLRETSSLDAATAELEAAFQRMPIAHLFLASSRNAETGDRTAPQQWDNIFETRSLIPYFLCQRWLTLAGDAGRLNDCTVVAITNLGGDLGFSGGVDAPESGFLTGLMKSLLIEYRIMREQSEFLAKAIDAPPAESPETLAACVCRELAHGSKDYELAFVNGQRCLQVAFAEPAQLQVENAPAPSGVWLLTGGARGITALCGLELGKRFGLKLHLLGTTPLDPIEESWRNMSEAQCNELRTQVFIKARQAGQKPNVAWAAVARRIEIDQNLRAFANAGISVTYHACDVSDRAALAKVLEQVRAQDGPISGILHGAAIDQSCRFEAKTVAGVRASVGAKVTGAYNLMMLTRQDPIRHFLGFGSISGRLGSNGQTDYSAGSDMLCKLVSWYRRLRPESHAVGFHWHPWGNAGMATRPETQAVLKASNLRVMPASIGVQHLLREVCGAAIDPEVLITDEEYHQRYYGTETEATSRRDDLLGKPGTHVPAPAVSQQSVPQRVAQRFVMRMADAPLTGVDNGIVIPSSVFLLGDNADADAMATKLESQNVRVVRLPVTDEHETACAALAQAWSETPASCLMLMTARDPEASQIDDPAVAAHRLKRGVYLPYWITRRWVQLLNDNAEAPATLVATTSLGGRFGFTGNVPSPEGGALSGLLKSLFVEDARYDHSRFRVKVIDLPASEPASQLAESVCRELTSGQPEVEVGWCGGKRQIVVTQQAPIAPSAGMSVERGTNWVVTGGARGITAAAALELAKRYQLKLHLLGVSPVPVPNSPWHNCTENKLKAIKFDIVRKAISEGRSPNDDWDRVRKDREIQQSLDTFAAAGVNVTYHSCDVSDDDDLNRVLSTIRAQAGPISGIIHGAGYAKPARFGAGLTADVPKTVAPKVDGTLALMRLTRQDPIRTFITFGSLSGRFGGNGLSEYAMANDMLAKLCGWFRGVRPECHTVCVHWQTWDQIGMATKSDSLEITRNNFKMQFLSPQEGAEHFVHEVLAGRADAEVLITDGYFQRAFYPYEMERTAASPLIEEQIATSADDVASGKNSPMIARWESESIDSGTAHVHFNPNSDPFLTQHLFRGKPFLPAVISIELLAEAARSALGDGFKNVLREVRIPNGLMFRTNDPMNARVTVAKNADGLDCRLLTELRDRQGRLIDGNRLQVQGVAPTNVPTTTINAQPVDNPPLGWMAHTYTDSNEGIYHGPPFRCLKGIALQYDGGWGQLVATPLAELAGSRGENGWSISPALLDSCLVACGGFLWMQFGGAFEVPYGFEQLTWTRQPLPGVECIVRFYFRGRGPKHSRFDFTLFGADGQPILEATGYETIRVGGGE